MLFFYFRNIEIQVEALASISGDLYVHVEAFASLPPPSYAPAGSPTVNGGQVCHLWLYSVLIPLVCHVHLHQYSWFGRIFSTVANRYRKSASSLKRSVSITIS